MKVMTSDNKAHAGYLLFPKAHELMYPQCVARGINSVWNNKKKQWKKNNKQARPQICNLTLNIFGFGSLLII
jgi:hypothetical protein